MSKYDPLEGKVVRVLNSRELVINLGADSGITVGMLFDVLDPKGEDIFDPETNERLGSLKRPKVRVKINSVAPKMSVASTYRTRDINVGGSGKAGMFAMGEIAGTLIHDLLPPKWIKEVETLKTAEKTWEDLDPKESYVKIGDPVIEAFEPPE